MSPVTAGLGLFVTGLVGFVFNKESLFQLVLALELMLLGGTLVVLGASWEGGDVEGELVGLYLIVLAGVESIVGLTLVLQHLRYYR